MFHRDVADDAPSRGNGKDSNRREDGSLEGRTRDTIRVVRSTRDDPLVPLTSFRNVKSTNNYTYRVRILDFEIFSTIRPTTDHSYENRVGDLPTERKVNTV